MQTPQEIITYWLCPAEPARRELSAIIRELAARFDAPVFEPHLTVYVAKAEGENAVAVLEQTVNRSRFRLAIRGVDYAEQFTKTLFVQFAPDNALAHFGEELRRASVSPTDYTLNPHLSLIYKSMDPEIKRRLASSIALSFAEVIFDSVKAVISPATIETTADIEAWRVVAERTLTG
jgi:2'-5' RNA ligase